MIRSVVPLMAFAFVASAPALAAASVEMGNLIGNEINRWEVILSDPHAHLHIYGKGEARPGRKMGHVTRLTLK
jgi:5-(carboxyamino)imidazole ribonucleotide synthase